MVGHGLVGVCHYKDYSNRGEARRGTARLGKVRQRLKSYSTSGKVGLGWVWLGGVGHGLVWQGLRNNIMARYGQVG